MECLQVWTIEILAAASLLLLALAVLLHVFQTRRRLAAIDIEGMRQRLASLEKSARDSEGAMEELRRDAAELKMATRTLASDLRDVKEESGRFLNIFKTVLYGFDYIVQGCKSALEVGPAAKPPEEKRIPPL